MFKMKNIYFLFTLVVLCFATLQTNAQSKRARTQFYNNYKTAVDIKTAEIMQNDYLYSQAVENSWFENIEKGLNNAKLFSEGKLGKSGKGTSCATADPFCTAEGSTYPAGVNNGQGEVGPAYGCLVSTPNPVWYYMKIKTSGNITITETNSNGIDVDFILWGPFATIAEATVATNMTEAKIVDCSFSVAAIGYIDIATAVEGEFYTLMVTNYSNNATDITLAKTAGTAETDCAIVNPLLPQVITFEDIPAKYVTDADFTLTATGGDSGNPIVFTSSNNNIATVSGNTVSLVSVGTCYIYANQAGNELYLPAVQVEQDLVVVNPLLPQVITFEDIPAKYVTDADFTLSATGGDSGNPIVFTSSNNNIATVSGNTVSLVSVGTCYIYANQAGNELYSPAEQVEQDLVVVELPVFEAPNFFSPNGDGRNDLWYIENPVLVAGYQLTIFNNIGEILYESEGYDNSWDGTYDGKELPSGTYYYTFVKDNEVLKGFITLIRSN